LTIDHRQNVRVPLSLEVEYRTAGAFLVAYSVNLSKGGVFLETESPMPIGTVLTLRFAVPGVGPLEVTGVVAWIRPPEVDSGPAGMGIEFERLDNSYGEVIDAIVSGFRGIRVVVLGRSAQARSVLARGVRSLFATAEITEAGDADAVERHFKLRAPDLVLVDLDESGPDGILTMRLAKTLCAAPVPVIASSRDEDTRLRARDLGADEILLSPATLPDMQTAVVRAISRPLRVG
jgi:uncharacterized protein (TIGR02266 family)